MDSKESEYKELFYVESLDNHEEMDRLFTVLEKDPTSQHSIDSIFRIVHTLKGNAMGMGFDNISSLSHVMEDIMEHVKNQSISLDLELFNSLYKANDKLGELIQAIKTDKKVSFLGIKTKLSVYLKNQLTKKEQRLKNPPIPKKVKPKKKEIELSKDELNRKKELISYIDNDFSSDKELKNEDTKEESPITFTDVIQIPVKKLDEMVNLIGQLIIERDRLVTEESEQGNHSSKFEVLQRVSSNLQYSIMNARMIPIGFLFNKFHRIVRDVSLAEAKDVVLNLKGIEVEIDRNILKIMSDSLIHLVRNSISHGIESPSQRLERNKPQNGSLTLNAYYEKDNVAIEVTDDGNGIDAKGIKKKLVSKGLISAKVAQNISDKDAIMYIFEPGFSNADKITDISGRGVGMDVVKKATEAIGGQVTVQTKVGQFTTIKLLLPASLSLKSALLFEVNKQEYAVALSFTEAVVTMRLDEINKLNGGLIMNFQDHTISLVFLKDLLGYKDYSNKVNSHALYSSYDNLDKEKLLDIIVVNYGGKQTGIVVDKFLYQKEIIEKPLEKPIDKVKILTGTTILGNGKVCPVLDISYITNVIYSQAIHSI